MKSHRPIDSKKIWDDQFWLTLCPELRITEDRSLQSVAKDADQSPPAAIRSDDWEICKEQINEDGYFSYDAWYSPELIERLAVCFARLHENQIHPIFAFVYDEFWSLLVQIEPLMSDLVDDYVLLPAVWAWFVSYENQTAFSPHRDQVRDVAVDDEDHLDYLTIWIPLNDLTHYSSSICVLPASCDPDYDMGTDNVCVQDLQDIRSLQGSKGSVFCWATGLVHWGTRQSRLGPPRMSVGFYVQNPNAECFDPPPMELDKPLTLKHRLAIIGQQIINYSRDADEDFLKFAQSLI